jgi:hypothetical protein
MTELDLQCRPVAKPPTSLADDRFESIGWGLVSFLVAVLLLPGGALQYVAVAVLGALMLVLNATRLATGLKIRWFSTVLGATALITGVGALAGVAINDVALFFVLAGAVAVVAGFRQAR